MKRLILGLIFLTACESDLAKIQRVEGDMNTHCLNEQYYYERYREAQTKNPKPTTETDTLGRRWSEHRAKCELLTREYNAIGR